MLVSFLAAVPAIAEAAPAAGVWRSEQFELGITFPEPWAVVDQASDPRRGDVVILGNEISALLIALLHDTRTPKQMAMDLVTNQKETTPDLALLQSTESASGSVVLLLQYTIHPQTAAAMLIDEKSLLGTLQAGESTVTIRGMVPDRHDVEAQFQEIEGIVSTLGVQ